MCLRSLTRGSLQSHEYPGFRVPSDLGWQLKLLRDASPIYFRGDSYSATRHQRSTLHATVEVLRDSNPLFSLVDLVAVHCDADDADTLGLVQPCASCFTL